MVKSEQKKNYFIETHRIGRISDYSFRMTRRKGRKHIIWRDALVLKKRWYGQKEFTKSFASFPAKEHVLLLLRKRRKYNANRMATILTLAGLIKP